ncbi:MAG: UrcA family protein [Pseudomonadota bacterium]
MKNLTFAIAATSMSFASIAAPAIANEPVTKTVKVHHSGLDLNTIEGQEMLEQRVEAAVRKVCGYSDVRTDSRLRRDVKTCVAKTRSSAHEQMAAIIEDQRRGG